MFNVSLSFSQVLCLSRDSCQNTGRHVSPATYSKVGQIAPRPQRMCGSLCSIWKLRTPSLYVFRNAMVLAMFKASLMPSHLIHPHDLWRSQIKA